MKLKALSISILFCLTTFASNEYIVDGSEMVIDQSGIGGRDGRDGFRCEDGEDGHDGYNGENATFFYENLKDLNFIQINLSGGRGGEGGRATVSSRRCEQNYYKRGKDGRLGAYGDIILVKDLKTLPKTIESATASLKKLTSENVILSKNHFIKKNGASLLFSKNSTISNFYKTFEYTQYESIETIFNSAETSNEQNKTKIKYRLSEELKVSSTNALIQSEIIKVEKGYKVVLNHIYPKSELNNLEFLSVSGKGRNLTLYFKDDSLFKNEIKNSYSGFFYKYSTFINWFVVVGSFSFPDSSVTIKNNIVSINIGRNPKLSEIFTSGQKMKIKFSNTKRLKDSDDRSEYISIGREIIFTVN